MVNAFNDKDLFTNRKSELNILRRSVKDLNEGRFISSSGQVEIDVLAKKYWYISKIGFTKEARDFAKENKIYISSRTEISALIQKL